MIGKSIYTGVGIACLMLAANPSPVAAQISRETLGTGVQCQIKINRGQKPGEFDAAVQITTGGGCICNVYTGPDTQAAATESRVSDIASNKTCPDARVMKVENVQNLLDASVQSQTNNVSGVATATSMSP